MVSRDELVQYCHSQLEHSGIKDYAPNGLQVEGNDQVKVIVSGVTACQSLLDKAAELKADLILVHHGFFWQRDNPCAVGMHKKRLKTLFDFNMNLLAYHLPLDCDKVFGNNVMLAEQLGFVIDSVHNVSSMPILFSGRLTQAMSAEDLSTLIENKLQRKPLVISNPTKQIQSIAWCTGGAQDYIVDAKSLGVDAYLSGEISERTTHFARENDIAYFASGHHATERYGVQALGEHLADKFGLSHTFIDIDNPV
jgi:dinuclear metal center YbgI/SA1388 family protein